PEPPGAQLHEWDQIGTMEKRRPTEGLPFLHPNLEQESGSSFERNEIETSRDVRTRDGRSKTLRCRPATKLGFDDRPIRWRSQRIDVARSRQRRIDVLPHRPLRSDFCEALDKRDPDVASRPGVHSISLTCSSHRRATVSHE